MHRNSVEAWSSGDLMIFFKKHCYVFHWSSAYVRIQRMARCYIWGRVVILQEASCGELLMCYPFVVGYKIWWNGLAYQLVWRGDCRVPMGSKWTLKCSLRM